MNTTITTLAALLTSFALAACGGASELDPGAGEGAEEGAAGSSADALTLAATPPRGTIGDFKANPRGPSGYSCTAGVGCNCWGNDDCKKLTDSGKCQGNPITCDPANPNACHCK